MRFSPRVFLPSSPRWSLEMRLYLVRGWAGAYASVAQARQGWKSAVSNKNRGRWFESIPMHCASSSVGRVTDEAGCNQKSQVRALPRTLG